MTGGGCLGLFLTFLNGGGCLGTFLTRPTGGGCWGPVAAVQAALVLDWSAGVWGSVGMVLVLGSSLAELGSAAPAPVWAHPLAEKTPWMASSRMANTR